MLEYFYEKYIELNLADFFDIGFDFKINKVLFFAFLGIIVACIFTNYIESGIALTLKRLLRTESHSEISAKSLKDLGLKDSRCAKIAIERRGGITARLILAVGERALTYEECIAEKKRLREEKKKRRKMRLDRLISIFKKNKTATEETIPDTPNTADGVASNEAKADSHGITTSATETTNTSVSTTLADGVESKAPLAETDTNASAEATVGDNPEKRYYIPEDMVDNAKRYLTRHAPTVTKTVLSCVLILGFYLLLAYLMPTIIDIVITLT